MNDSDPTSRPTVTGVLRRYRRRAACHTVCRDSPTTEVSTCQAKRIIGLLSHCRQGPLGCHAYRCEQCNERHVRMNSCGNRHCPTCGCRRRWEWRERVIGWSLDCDYLHTVVTLPHELNPLMRANQAEMYRLLFRCSIDTLSGVAAKEYGCQVGMMATLHTWGQRLNQHVHVHVLMTAGGRSLDGQRWISITAADPAMDRWKLADAFKKTYLKRLKTLYKKDRLQWPEEAFNALVNKIQGKRWIVDVKATPPEYQGAEAIVNYLAAYISGAAISDGRMISDDGEIVTIRMKDYNTGKSALLPLPGQEFVDRFSLHILPHRLQRLRYAGMFQARGRDARLAECRKLIEEAGLTRKKPETAATTDVDTKDHTSEVDEAPPEKIEHQCKCGAAMRRMGRLGGGMTMQLIRRVAVLTAALAAGPNEAILDPLREELKPPPANQQSLLSALAPSYHQLESFVVLTLVEARLAAQLEATSPPEAELQGLPPPAPKAVA